MEIQQVASDMILWAFRGQEDSKWDLNSTFHRIAEKHKLYAKMFWHKEYYMLRQFTRRARHYCEHIPPENDLFEWLSIMQHHGAPTRLLDFSHSMFISAFFAMENANSDAAIWAINLQYIQRESMAQYGIDADRTNIDHFNLEMIKVANRIISDDGKKEPDTVKGVFNIEPERLHERILNQQGLFLFPTDIGCGFAENIGIIGLDHNFINSVISQIDKTQDFIIKFIIPYELKREILNSLHSMNINARTLFPGLDGFARSMQTLMLGP